MRSALIRIIELVLSLPILFELQQKIFNNYAALKSEYSPILAMNSGINILDVGCSTGTCAGSILDLNTCTLVGIDLHKRYVARAKRSFPDGHFLAMDASKLGFKENTFDVVMINSVLHHLPDDVIINSLSEIERSLRDDGSLLIAEPIFSKNRVVSNLLLTIDRGEYIRQRSEYRDFLSRFEIKCDNVFDYFPHQFCSFVAQKKVNG